MTPSLAPGSPALAEGIDAPSLLDAPMFDALDRQFAAFLLRLARSTSPRLAIAAALVSNATRAGHVCLDLRSMAGTALAGEETATFEPLPPLDLWCQELADSPVVGQPGEFKPLILDGQGRLYLQRYWHYETVLVQGIESRLNAAHPGPALGSHVDSPSLASILDRYFPRQDSRDPDWQRTAVEAALTHRFAVISGGPGTGKTHTIAVFVAALLEYAGDPAPRIALAAPTGKATIRLQEAIQNARLKLPCPAAVLDRIPTSASTLHRLLGSRPGTNAFRHNASSPLPFDVIVVDEASMVDLALMAKLFAACPPGARLILVGDMDQLASVEAGAVLGDICDGVRQRPSLDSAPLSPLDRCIVQLRRNHRFKDGDGIAALSRALNAGDGAAALKLLQSGASGAASVRSLPPLKDLAAQLRKPIAQLFDSALSAPDPGAAVRGLAAFRILCALRRGPFGTETLNQSIEKMLRDTGLVTATTPFYPGRPVLILKNDYNLRLFNGDIGLVLPHPQTGELRVWFLDAEGETRDFATGRLPEHETVFAMTVHKSQGSEFQNVLMILPDRDSPVLTRELIYTGVTRARQSVELWLDEATFLQGLARRTQRTSGLAARLWGASLKDRSSS